MKRISEGISIHVTRTSPERRMKSSFESKRWKSLNGEIQIAFRMKIPIRKKMEIQTKEKLKGRKGLP